MPLTTVSVDVGQPEVAALVTAGRPFVIDAEAPGGNRPFPVL